MPLDDEMPRYRMELIFETLQARAVICDEKTRKVMEQLQFEGEIFLYEDMIRHPEDPEALGRIRSQALDIDPIYVVFTSGSTGVPKGVAACHRSVLDYVENLSQVLGFGEDTVFANQSPFYFDACLKELYPTMMFGATTYIVPKSLFMFPVRLVEFLNRHQVNTICWVVSALTMISFLRHLRYRKAGVFKDHCLRQRSISHPPVPPLEGGCAAGPASSTCTDRRRPRACPVITR